MVFMGRQQKDLIGQKFGRLTVMALHEERNQYELERKLAGEIKQNRKFYICTCDCGNENISVSHSNLASGHATSCGCYHREKTKMVAVTYLKKYNEYDLSGDIGICHLDDSNEKVLFDIEDYDLIKNILWKLDESGYARGYDVVSKKYIRMHKIITNTNKDTIVDHINMNKLDNRKENFRFATHSQNRINSPVRSNNTTGIQGVTFENNKWRSRITVNNKSIHLGVFDDFNDAVITRLKAEKKYYKEFAMQRHLFDKYGI